MPLYGLPRFGSRLYITLRRCLHVNKKIVVSDGLTLELEFFTVRFFNMPNSGIDEPGFFNATIAGPEWLTGGAFGIEASYISIS